MRDTLILLLILVIAIAVYWPIMRIARRDLAERNEAGMGNGVVYAILLLPLFGPIIYLVFRNRFRVK
jgi:hypothetical protein